MPDSLWRQLLTIWQLFLALMSTPEGQAFLDAVEYTVKDIADGPDQHPDQPASVASAGKGPRKVGGQS